MLERDVIAGVLKEAKRLGIQYIRMSFMQGAAAGWPDYLFLLPGGRTLWIEFKAPGAMPTKLQAHRLAMLDSLGHDVHVVDDPAKGVILLLCALDYATTVQRSKRVQPA